MKANRRLVEISSAKREAALLRFSDEAAQIFLLKPFQKPDNFFLFITDYFFDVMNYFSACSDVCVKQTGCRPSTDNKGDAHVHPFNLLQGP
ncbi:UNVERIFIED_ORG: hypothetical protein ABIC62_005313 [Burkholderia sp. 1595]|uniref:hypothetical protein n=1 Tax=Paraburkholderia terricola TaxID=169427 RepID=UPI00115FE688|nr:MULTISPECIES: hypothetical protein [Paraburkholderia]